MEPLKKAEMFLHTLDAWVGVPAMKEARSSHASTGFLDSSLIVFSGVGEEQQHDINSVE